MIFEIHETATTGEYRTVHCDADTIVAEFIHAFSHYAADSSVMVCVIAIDGATETRAMWEGSEDSLTWESSDWDACGKVMELMGASTTGSN